MNSLRFRGPGQYVASQNVTGATVLGLVPYKQCVTSGDSLDVCPYPLIVCRLIAIFLPSIRLVTSPQQSNLQLAFGQAVRRFRVKRGISQERLAELADIHRTYIGDVERGTRNISLLNMTRIAKALQVPLSRLIQEMES
jgi:DNA-binding XRE family transcriptional regulator